MHRVKDEGIEMDNLKEFKKLVKSLPEGQQSRLPEKIREICNSRTEHTEFLKAVVLGVYLDLTDEISLLGYVHVPVEISKDQQYCTTIRDNHTDKMIVGLSDKVSSDLSFEDFKRKILFALTLFPFEDQTVHNRKRVYLINQVKMR